MSRFLSKFDRDEEGTTVSVGSALRDRTVYTHSHPAYQKIANLVTEEVAAIASRDAEKRSRACPVVMTAVLNTVETEQLTREYPELRIVSYGMDRPGHAFMTASIAMANELLLHSAQKLASSVIHLGGSLMSSIMKEDMDIHIEMDPSCAGAVHSRNRDTRNTARVMGDYATFVADVGRSPARANYEAYLRKTAYSLCTRSGNCNHSAEVFLADLATYNMSPAQFCSAMRQCDAQLGYGFFIYHPVMLLAKSGEIPGTGVLFEKTEHSVYFKYPNGVSGVESYPLSEWGAWLSEHIIHVGKGAARTSYHVQLTKCRGPFMFFSVTLASDEVRGVTLRHALDLPMVEKQYVVTSWVLKDLVRDPSRADSWERCVFMVPAKVVDDLYAFGLQLTPESFNRHAIRKRLQVVDRVTLEGTSIAFGFRPTRAQEDALVTAVHARLFVERYESGQLAKHLMERLKTVAGFGSASAADKVKAVALWSLRYVWDFSFGAVGEAMGALCDWLDKFFGPYRPPVPSFTLAPEYVSFETVVSQWRDAQWNGHSDAVKALSGFDVVGSASGLKGGAVATALAKFNRTSASYMLSAARRLSDVYAGTSISHHKHVRLDDEPQMSTVPEVSDTLRLELEDAIATEISALNALDEAPVTRDTNPTETVVRVMAVTEVTVPDFHYDPDYVGTMNEVYHEFNPEVAHAPLEMDIASISQQDQDRTLAADYLRLPRVMDMAPRDRAYYLSKVKALGAPKRQETQQELLSSVAARNLAAPVVSLPQDAKTLIPQIWDNFLDRMCVEGARSKIATFLADPVALDEGAYRDWMSKARPEVLSRVISQLRETGKALEEMDVGQYIMMLKADVKPPLSDKPVRSRIEPQVIVYHEKAMSSMYSSIFRVLVNRFLSLLKPEVHVNLKKDTRDIASFIRANHPFGDKLQYLENDFSKYDKSQGEFAFQLEEYVFGQLGMNRAMLDKWVKGHEDCTIRSFVTGMLLHVRFQRKSGDATTAFGNVILNVLSVSFAYGIINFAWAVFMGDDSLVACRKVGYTEDSVAILAEIFNLSAKMYITDAPYCFSNFVVLDEENQHVELVPDPIKWVEKRSQPVSAEEPRWSELYISATDTGKPYLYQANTHRLGKLVAQRYPIKRQSANRLASAIATAISHFDRYRGCYEEKPTTIHY